MFRFCNHETKIDIMFNVVKWFTGFITVLQCRETSSDCKISTGKIYYADCVGQELKELPKEIDERLEVLNISASNGIPLLEEQFRKYPNLRELIIRNVTFIGGYSPEFLLVLPNLQILDFSYSWVSFPAPRLPSTITHLYLNELMFGSEFQIGQFNLADLNNLKEISLKSNILSDLPLLSAEAPIVSIDLGGNPIRYLRYSDIVYFCELEKFMLEKYYSAPNQSYINRCCFLKTWLDEHHILSNLKCASNCSVGKYNTFVADLEEIHDKCYERVKLKFTDIFQLIFNVCLTVVAFLLVISFFFMIYFHILDNIIAEAMSEEHGEESHMEEESTGV